MQIEIDNSVSVRRRDFYDLRDELLDAGLKFDAIRIASLPYNQLHLCSMANAGKTACAPNIVQQEKESRRSRYLHMEPDEFKAATNYLKMERMYDDVMQVISLQYTPRWGELNDRQKVWVKLTCLTNHLDNPHPRLGEAILLFRKCATTLLPREVAMAFMEKLKGIITVYPGRLSDETYRDKLLEMKAGLIDFLPEAERTRLQAEQIQDYSCTSDCFRVPLVFSPQ